MREMYVFRMIFSVILLLAIAMKSVAQDSEVVDRYDEHVEQMPMVNLSVRTAMNFQDVALGGTVGLNKPGGDFRYFVSFDARPYRRKELAYQGNNLWYQYAESRFFTGAGIEYFKTLANPMFSVFMQLNASYSWGRYGGTEIKPDAGVVLTPRMGLAMDYGRFQQLKVGYAYLDAKNKELDRHRLFIAYGIYFNGSR